MEEISVSFIVVNFRTPDLVLRCVHSIQEHTLDQSYEIIIVDNASGDDSAEKLAGLPGVTFIANPNNAGFGVANNQGAKSARGKYLFFLNPDAYLLNDAVGIFSAFMNKQENQSVVCCGGHLMDEEGNAQMSHGNFPSLLEVFSQIGFHRLYPSYFEKKLSISLRNDSDDIKQVDYVLGAGMFVRAEIFKMVGGFDNQFFLYFEETELAYRLKKAGYEFVLVPQAKIVHFEGGFDKDGVPNYAKIKWFAESRQLYFNKTKGPGVALLVKLLLGLHAFGQWVYHRDRRYFNVFRIIVKS